jgi:hypothetical protein
MSTDRDVTQSVRSWLDEGVTALPDRVLDAVLDRLPATPQRRATWWPVRRLPVMNTTAKLAVTAAVVILVAFLGFNYLQGSNTGNPGIDDASPTPTPEPQALVEGAAGPGTFSTTPFSGETVRFTFDMPAGWQGGSEWLVGPVSTADDGSALLFLQVDGLYSDPCASAGSPDVSVGSTADDLAAALMAQTAYEATLTENRTIDGYPTTRLELVMPSDLDYSGCTDGFFRVWDGPPGSGQPNRWYLWIVDVEDTPVLLVADVTAATEQHEAQIEDMVLSLQIEP